MPTLCNIIHKDDHHTLKQMISVQPTLIHEYHKHDNSCKLFTQWYQIKYRYCAYDSMTLLHIAVSAESYECTQLLLEQKADPNCKTSHNNQENATPLHIAQNITFVNMLLQYTKSVNERSLYGETPLEIALLFHTKPNLLVAAELVRYGADVNYTDPSSQETLLYKAIKHTAFTVYIVTFLLKNGADRTECNQFGKTPLQYAIQLHNGYEELINLLR